LLASPRVDCDDISGEQRTIKLESTLLVARALVVDRETRERSVHGDLELEPGLDTTLVLKLRPLDHRRSLTSNKGGVETVEVRVETHDRNIHLWILRKQVRLERLNSSGNIHKCLALKVEAKDDLRLRHEVSIEILPEISDRGVHVVRLEAKTYDDIPAVPSTCLVDGSIHLS